MKYRRPEYKNKFQAQHDAKDAERRAFFAGPKADDFHNHVYLNMTGKWWYTPGNIVRSSYDNYPGFWLCESTPFGVLLTPCDANGRGLLGQSRHPGEPEGWHWKNLNEGQHPAVDRYNAAHREVYLMCPDGYWDAYHAEEKRLQAEQEAWRETLTPFEREMISFDWTWQEADQHYPGKHEQCESIKARLEAMPLAEAKAIWEDCGPRGYRGAGHPNWTKCAGYEYPKEYLFSYHTKFGMPGSTYELWRDGKIVASYQTHGNHTWDFKDLGKWIDKMKIAGDVPRLSRGECYSTVKEFRDEIANMDRRFD